ncbi:apoptosis inhibitor 5-like [Dysidea avara]|uniref:apoptosis inhibitor 5-like n=1 Tax=Dysidea avara TaxID=196820 RepID=UPI00331BF73E
MTELAFDCLRAHSKKTGAELRHKDVYEAILAATKGSRGAKRLATTLYQNVDQNFRMMLLWMLCLTCWKMRGSYRAITGEEQFNFGDQEIPEGGDRMAGLFSQVMGEDDMTREKCIEFVCNSIMKHKNELFTKNFETEQFFIKQLRTMATTKGAQDLVDIVANQADLSSDFQERGAPLDPFISFVCHKVFPILPVMEAKDSIDDILQLYAQSFLCSVTVELAKSVIELLYDMLLIHKVVHAITGDINSLVKQPKIVQMCWNNSYLLLFSSLARDQYQLNDTATSPAPKRKVSPIRLSSAANAATAGKHQPWSVYEPSKGSYSNKLDTSDLPESNWQDGWGTGRCNR